MDVGVPRELPDFERPPVVEITVAVQFQPLIVEGFTAITHDVMHAQWGRFR